MIKGMLPPLFAAMLLGGCGLTGTSGATVTTGAAAAEQASEAKNSINRVESDLGAAQQAAAQARRAAEEGAQ
jgi:uncharacterized lipoprotein YajG